MQLTTEHIQLLLSIAGPFATIAGVWALIKYRLDRLEKDIYGNGHDGLKKQVDDIEVRCAARHGIAGITPEAQ